MGWLPARVAENDGTARGGCKISDIYDLLDQLEDLVIKEGRFKVARMTYINEERFGVLLRQIRSSLPEELDKARRIIAAEAAILEEARASAEEMRQTAEREAAEKIADAEAQARQLVSQNRITEQANVEAVSICRQAEKEAQAMRQGAEEYAFDIVRRVKNLVTALDQSVTASIEQMQLPDQPPQPKEEETG